MLSVISVQGIPSCTSSHAVSRAPCRYGRVSFAITEMFLSLAERITPSAVPNPAVASAPVLQWVMTRARSGIRLAPRLPIARFAARSSS